MPAPGVAKTNKFLLSTATVMIGAMADLHKLNPTEHSIGLVKNFQVTSDPGYLDLGQGITNQVVMSVKNQDGIKASMEVYEFTLRNLAYGAGLDGSGTSFDVMPNPWAVSAASTSTSIKTGVDITADLDAGDFIFIQKGVEDVVHIAKVDTVAFATSESTVTLETGFEIPTGMSFNVGDRFGKIKKLAIGGDVFQPTLAAKVVGLLPGDNTPFTILFPKLKITKGLGVSMQADNYSNLPFEFTPYAGISGEPFYDEYGSSSMVLFPR